MILRGPVQPCTCLNALSFAAGPFGQQVGGPSSGWQQPSGAVGCSTALMQTGSTSAELRRSSGAAEQSGRHFFQASTSGMNLKACIAFCNCIRHCSW